MVTKRVRDKAPAAVARLLRGAMRHEDGSEMTIEELGELTGWGRYAGAFVRGEVQRPSPDQIRALATHLPITQRQLLDAYGFDVGLTRQEQLPKPLLDALLVLEADDLQAVTEVARQLARARGRLPAASDVAG